MGARCYVSVRTRLGRSCRPAVQERRLRRTTSSSPFSPTELVARLRAALRRHDEPEPFVLGELAIDYQRRRVTVGGAAVDFTATEYELLRVLSLDAELGRALRYAAAPGLDQARERRCEHGADRVSQCDENRARSDGGPNQVAAKRPVSSADDFRHPLQPRQSMGGEMQG